MKCLNSALLTSVNIWLFILLDGTKAGISQKLNLDSRCRPNFCGPRGDGCVKTGSASLSRAQRRGRAGHGRTCASSFPRPRVPDHAFVSFTSHCGFWPFTHRREAMVTVRARQGGMDACQVRHLLLSLVGHVSFTHTHTRVCVYNYIQHTHININIKHLEGRPDLAKHLTHAYLLLLSFRVPNSCAVHPGTCENVTSMFLSD